MSPTADMISVNGTPFPWRPGLTVADVIREKNYKFPLLVVRVGDRLVRRDEYATASIPRGSDVLIHHLVSGG